MRYGSAVLVVVLATGVRLLLDPVFGDGFPFITFFLTVVFVAWLVGFGPSLAALVLSCISAAYFILPPRGGLAIQSSENQVGLVIFFLAGLAIALLAGSLRDAQRRVQRAEEAERAHREQLHVTLRSIGDAVIATDKDGRVSFVNPVAEKLTGWTQAQADKAPLASVFKILNEQTRQPVDDPVARVLRDGAVIGLGNHTILIAQDGSEKPIDDSAAPIIDQNGNVSGVVLVFRDVTERRRLERMQRDLHQELERQVQDRTAELRATEERFRLLVEGTKDYAIFMLDAQGNIASWNPGAERIKGYRADEIIGQHFGRFYPEEEVQQGKPARELDMAAAQGTYTEEGWRLRKDGSRFWASVLITALRDDKGHLRGFSKITRDMTEKKAAEEALQRSHDELEVRVQQRTAELAQANQGLQEEIAHRWKA